MTKIGGQQGTVFVLDSLSLYVFHLPIDNIALKTSAPEYSSAYAFVGCLF